ncbi:MAG: Unknown protein [uncultured Sulfurovum sp.]|uniref:Lipoprotein n=1 Tax=uncultured Sulfurovum sp. TaxID=269237 RepID=A0A6S6T7B3_9BACT|nr:MAG: Unknown protein [uncultured Sulfurovum sp.]
MRSHSVIIFGFFSALLLILSCITLKASKFYNELEINTDTHLVLKPTLELRDRNLKTIKDVN